MLLAEVELVTVVTEVGALLCVVVSVLDGPRTNPGGKKALMSTCLALLSRLSTLFTGAVVVVVEVVALLSRNPGGNSLDGSSNLMWLSNAWRDLGLADVVSIFPLKSAGKKEEMSSWNLILLSSPPKEDRAEAISVLFFGFGLNKVFLVVFSSGVSVTFDVSSAGVVVVVVVLFR